MKKDHAEVVKGRVMLTKEAQLYADGWRKLCKEVS